MGFRSTGNNCGDSLRSLKKGGVGRESSVLSKMQQSNKLFELNQHSFSMDTLRQLYSWFMLPEINSGGKTKTEMSPLIMLV